MRVALARSAGRARPARAARPTRAARPAASARPWIASGSPMMSPTLIRGLSEPYGSWKTICIRRRAAQQLPRRQRDAGRGPRSGSRPALGSMQPQDAAGPRRLAAAGLADEPQRLAGLEREAHAVHRADHAAAPRRARLPPHRELLGEVLDLEQRAGASRRVTGQATQWPGSRAVERGLVAPAALGTAWGQRGREAAAGARPAEVGRRARRWRRAARPMRLGAAGSASSPRV